MTQHPAGDGDTRPTDRERLTGLVAGLLCRERHQRPDNAKACVNCESVATHVYAEPINAVLAARAPAPPDAAKTLHSTQVRMDKGGWRADCASEYVVGFAFDSSRNVALILKNRPEWQAGRLNGIGGHVEPGESADDAMRREFREETGADVTTWEPFVVMEFPGALITFYRAWVDAEVLRGLRTMTDEAVHVIPWASPFEYVMPADWVANLDWLLPLAAYTADRYEPIYVTATVAEAITADPGTRGEGDDRG